MLAIDIARVAHEANRVLQAIHADPGVPVAAPWDEFPDDEQAGVVAGVEAALAGAGPVELHDAWCARKIAEGWVWGPVKDPGQKTHPCLVPYRELPAAQQAKDRLFYGVVAALSDAHDNGRNYESVVVQGTREGGDARRFELNGIPLRHVTGYEVREDADEQPWQLVTLQFRSRDVTVLPPELSP